MRKILYLCLLPYVLLGAGNYDTLMELSLEELLEVEVTTVSKKQTNAFESSSSITIITQEDIRRSGLTSVPELMRLIPGMHVGRISGNTWAINSRASNTPISHDMRIMIDGRDLYNTFFNGVYWDSVNLVLEDIERIEVVRGPGASLWGTNTAHGVVNIITKKTVETEGALVSGSYGTGQDRYTVSARYGFSHAKGASRLYATQRDVDRSSVSNDPNEDSFQNRTPALGGPRITGAEAYDGHDMSQAGFVSELSLNLDNRLRISGDVYKGESEEEGASPLDRVELEGGNVHVNFESDIALNSSVSFAAYLDYFSRDKKDQHNHMRVIDVNFQHVTALDNHGLVWGGEYKNSRNSFTYNGGSYNLGMDPSSKTDEVYSLFIQDDIRFGKGQFILTPGLKYGHNDYTGETYQPSLRAAYLPSEATTLWAAATRSEAEPSRLAVDGYLDLNTLAQYVPCTLPSSSGGLGGVQDPELGCVIKFLDDGEAVESSVILTYELGYRQKLSERLILDNTLFYDDYKHQGNDGSNAEYIYGYEFNGKYLATQDWKLDLSYVYHYGRDQQDAPNLTLPKHTVIASSYYTYNIHTDLDLSYYFLDDTKSVGSYSRLDLRVEHRPLKDLRLSLTAQNLLEDEHIESNYDTTEGNSVVERAVIAKVSYAF